MEVILTINKASIENKLRSWHDLEKRRQFLERKIPELEERLQRLVSKLSKDGILSSIIQQTENMDMPRGFDVTDRVGNAVASALDDIAETKATLIEWQTELERVHTKLADIEGVVNQFKESYQPIVIRYFRDGWTQKKVAEASAYSQQRVDQILDKCVGSFHQAWI